MRTGEEKTTNYDAIILDISEFEGVNLWTERSPSRPDAMNEREPRDTHRQYLRATWEGDDQVDRKTVDTKDES